jgi:uncharacterized damage-inducible protein DinB
MTWTAPTITRTEPPEVAGEREAVQAWLDYHRATLLFKCEGLTGEQLVKRAVPPSSLSLLGLVRHMSEVERSWFRRRFRGEAGLGSLYCSDEYPDGDFDLTDPQRAEQDLATYRRECELADAAVADAALDDTYSFSRIGGAPMDLRWIFLHMIEEYARHNGHADFLREQIDGVTGD